MFGILMVHSCLVGKWFDIQRHINTKHFVWIQDCPTIQNQFTYRMFGIWIPIVLNTFEPDPNFIFKLFSQVFLGTVGI